MKEESKKTQDSNDSKSEIEWDFEEMKKAILDSADDYDKLVGG
tara:strand:- start:66 stop:194 length:129 start_codon:yes stop_codon:yes gene_type:complete